jgi:hypothetical protein
MKTLNPSNRRAERGVRLVRASMVVGLAVAVGLQAPDGTDEAARMAHDASIGFGAAAMSPLVAL